MPISSSSAKFSDLAIGAVFTPLEWAKFAIRQFDIYQKWMDGATVLDPTMGEGNLLEALIQMGVENGIAPKNLPVGNLFGVEMNPVFFNRFFQKIHEKYGIELPIKNFQNADFFYLPNEPKCDILLGNPPWQNFVDLPESYKERIKSQFFRYDLIGNAKDLLLGGSRIDIAALVVQKAIEKNLKQGGDSVFFIPLSLYLNDGANRFFRTYKVNSTRYCVCQIFDFNDLAVFEGIATRYGLVHIKRDEIQEFPISYMRWENSSWGAYSAKPVFHETDPLSITTFEECSWMSDMKPIVLLKESMPRQGLNTGGANDCFFFDKFEEVDDRLVCVSNQTVGSVLLPSNYIFPLLTAKNFQNKTLAAQKWVLMPHNHNGKPLDAVQLNREPELLQYLLIYRHVLESRKGVMVLSWIKRGNWWALLGVGDYNFFPWKIVWEAYGKTVFSPMLFPGYWQANQSLQAFIPVRSKENGERILLELKKPPVSAYLASLKMEGTMNWAQPGKIKKLLQFEEDALTLF